MMKIQAKAIISEGIMIVKIMILGEAPYICSEDEYNFIQGNFVIST